ncbi:DUF5681 domain-containing protein [Phenylobacterium sp.]|uniref:DUF5681 domain-containing protein n=1 Tax=Phenylobacterium sp. TaxID=1871053 RepID=UPI0026350ECA|nr:DUF5681 domain-containing protein [Phenylobacterium sp.]
MTDDETEDRGGYKRPPKHGQFKPGQSGNPKGRPRKRAVSSDADADRIFLEEALKLVPIVENGKRKKVPALQAIYKRCIQLAMQGDHRAINSFNKSLAKAVANPLVQQAYQKAPEIPDDPNEAARVYLDFIAGRVR